jgi:hypothetical protein
VTLGPLGLVDMDDPPLSLADEAISLAEEYLRVPSGLKAGEPLELTPEQIEFLIENIGMMDEGYFVSRGDILKWLNEVLQVKIVF